MAYSNENPAFDRAQKGAHDALRQEEVSIAAALMEHVPGLRRSAALVEAARIVRSRSTTSN